MVNEVQNDPPECSKNTTKQWCLEDDDYPKEMMTFALEQHYEAVRFLHEDVKAETSNSVDTLNSLEEETYLCPATTTYVQPLRAVNVEGKWRIIVNNADSYGYKLDQHVRLEECEEAEASCPHVPSCYDSKCLQKNMYHRFLVYDPNDYYFPFAIENFKLPSSCACFLGAFSL